MLKAQADYVQDKLEAANQRLFNAFRGRNHAEVEAALKAGANPNAVDKNGDPAIFSIDPADTRSLVLLLKAGADADGERYVIDKKSKKAQPQTTLIEELAGDLSEVTPMLRSQLHRIQVLLAGGASTRGIEGTLADHWSKLISESHGGPDGGRHPGYQEAIDALEETIHLVQRIAKEGDSARPKLDALFPTPKVTGEKEAEGYVHFGTRALTN